MTDLVVRGGTVYTAGGPRRADVHVAEGVITSLEAGAGGGEEVDARGLLVLPGAIDAHVHSRDPGATEKEDWGSLTEAAAAGGVTTVVDMPNTVPAVDSAAIFLDKAERASAKALVDFALWGLLRSGTEPSQASDLLEVGAVGLKAYLGYAFRLSNRQVVYTTESGGDLEAPPDYGTIARLAPDLARAGAPLAAHAEDAGVLRAFARPLRSYADLLASRPALAEAVAVAALGVISQRTGVTVRVVHLSSGLGLAAARAANRAGARLALETCPQYLWLSEADHERLGTLMKMYPAVRTLADRAALREALRGGEIPAVATDHAPHTDVEKLDRSLEEALPGSPGVETLYLSCLELARQFGDIGLAPGWVSRGPALALGLHPRKGMLEPGADADLVLVDPHAETLVSAPRLHSRQRHSALEGQRFSFAVRAVYSRGELVAREGEPLARQGRGRLLRPVRQRL